eukprot:8947512-Pyramimonas_sp.AAC.1
MTSPLILGLSLLRYNRAGAWLRLRRSSESAYDGQFSLYSSLFTALSCGLQIRWNIRVQLDCAQECTQLHSTARKLAAIVLFKRRQNAWKHAIRYAAASDPTQTYDDKT